MNGNEGKIGLLQQLKDLEQERINLEIEIDLEQESYTRIQNILEELNRKSDSFKFFDEYAKHKKLTEQEKEIQTNLLLKKVICLIAKKDAIDLESSEVLFKNSETYQILKSNILYKESVESIYTRYKEEQKKKLIKRLKNKSEILEAIQDRTRETVKVLASENIDIIESQKIAA